MSALDMLGPGNTAAVAAGPATGRSPAHASTPTPHQQQQQSNAFATAHNIQSLMSSRDSAPAQIDALGPGYSKEDPIVLSPGPTPPPSGPVSDREREQEARSARILGSIEAGRNVGSPSTDTLHANRQPLAPSGSSMSEVSSSSTHCAGVSQPPQSSRKPLNSPTSEAPESSSRAATTWVGDLLWTAYDDSCLLASIERQGVSWKEVHKDFVATCTRPRTAEALHTRWNRLLRQGKSSPQLTAAKRAADATSRSSLQRSDGWTQEEIDAVRKALAEGEEMESVYAAYEARFGTSKRSRQAIRRRIHQWRAEGRSDDDTQDEDEDVSEDEGSKDSEDEAQYASSESESEGGSINMAAPSTSRAGRIRLPPTAGSVQRHDGWTQSEDRLLLACVACHRSHSVAWTKVFAEFSEANHRERSKAALETRWRHLRKQGGAASSSKTTCESRKRLSGKKLMSQRQAASRAQRYEPYNDDPLMTYADPHQYRDEDHASRAHPSVSVAPRFTTPQRLHAPLVDLNLTVGISYEQNGVRIDGCVPGLEIMVFSATCVKISGSGYTTAKSEQPAFHLRVVERGGVVGVRLPHGTTQSIQLVPRREEGGFAGGDAGGLARGLAVQTSYVSVEGYTIVLIS